MRGPVELTPSACLPRTAQDLQQASVHHERVSTSSCWTEEYKQLLVGWLNTQATLSTRFPGLGLASVAFVCYVLYDNLTSKESLEKAKHEADTRSLLKSGLLTEIRKERGAESH